MTGLAVKVAMATDMEESPSALNRATGHVTVPIQRMTKRRFPEKVHEARPNRDLEPNPTIYVIVVAKRVTGHLSVPTRAAHQSGHGDLETERGLRTAIMIHGTAIVPKIAGKGPRTEDEGPGTDAQTLRSSVVKVQIPRIVHGLAHQQNR